MNRSIWILPEISGFSIQMVSADRNENQENQKKENFTEQIHVHFRPS